MIPELFAKYIGIPYVDKGRVITGLDCWGLFRLPFLDELGIELESFTDDYETANDTTIVRSLIDGNIDTQWKKHPITEAQCWDGLLINMGKSYHVALIAVPGIMLHIQKGSGSCLERYDCTKWRHRIVGLYRHADFCN